VNDSEILMYSEAKINNVQRILRLFKNQIVSLDTQIELSDQRRKIRQKLDKNVNQIMKTKRKAYQKLHSQEVKPNPRKLINEFSFMDVLPTDAKQKRKIVNEFSFKIRKEITRISEAFGEMENKK
jgi:hypothetical protein